MSKRVVESSFEGRPFECELDPVVICEETDNAGLMMMHDVDGQVMMGAKDLNEKIETICRCCLTERDDLIAIFDSENEVYSMITLLTSIQISLDDALPKNICVFCFDQLNNSVSFKQRIESADATLRQCFNERFTEEMELHEPGAMEQNYSELPFEQDSEGNIVEVFEDPIEEDYESGYITVVENVEPSTSEIAAEIPESKSEPNLQFEINPNLPEKSKKTYNCPKCNKDFCNRQLFAKHMKVHQNQNRYSCNICNRTFSHEANFEAHVATHDEKAQQNDDPSNDSFKCNKCDLSFIIERDLFIHGSIHDEDGGFKCRECFKEFPNLQKLRRHVKTHYQDKPIKCDECGRGFPEMASLTRHYRVHTNEQRERKHICSCCNKSYYDSHSLSIHVRKHTGEKPWACDKCDKRFIDSRLLNSHMRTHSNEKKYVCTICDNGFTHRSTLVSHMRIHTGEKPFVCTICNRSFGQSSNLILHKRVHSGEKPYKCTQCPKAFRSSSSLALHVRTHTGEKPYGCSICGKFFARYNLTIHMRTHNGERPYECLECPRRFKTSAQLVQHKRTHTGEKPYVCGICDKRWTSSSYLKKHMLTHSESPENVSNASILMEQNDHHRIRIEEIQSDAEFNENAMLVNDLLASVGNVNADVLHNVNVVDVPELSTNDSNPGLDLNNAINPNILRIQQCKNESGEMYAMEARKADFIS